jgi:hypothetical protein
MVVAAFWKSTVGGREKAKYFICYLPGVNTQEQKNRPAEQNASWRLILAIKSTGHVL